MAQNQIQQDILAGKRLLSLDVFRGATIAAMIMVNNPGSWNYMYAPLQHADWHGLTVTDLIFPFFLFIVGVSIVLAFSKQQGQGVTDRALVKKITIRTIIIFGLGLLMHGFPYVTFQDGFGIHDYLSNLRIMGVLQRIALCYMAASLMYLFLKPKTILWIMGGILVIYWMLTMFVPVPGFGAGMIDERETNLAAWLDRLIFTRAHLWDGMVYDPEGLLSTFPAIVTTLVGVFTGKILFSNRDVYEKISLFFLWGFFLFTLGYVWGWFFPINKALWTSSYALLVAGLAMMVFATTYWLVDVKGYKRFTHLFVVYGMNPLIVFFMSGILSRALYITELSVDGEVITLKNYIFETIFLTVASPINASLLYSIVWVLAWFAVVSYMYKKKIFIKV
jgi:predicted acyltransferase